VPEPAGESPYPGPRPFEQADRALFFGREAETRELVSLVVAHRVVLLYAASGAGKTSLLNAGVIPVLEEEEGFEVLPRFRVRATAEQSPPEQAANAYAYAALSNLGSDLGLELDEARLASLTLAEFLTEREPARDDQGVPAPRVAIFDQFEELFTVYPKYWAQREAFVRQIADLLELEPPVRVVLVMREDHVAELASYASLLPDGFRIRLRLEGLRREAALRAVTRPLEGTGRVFAPGAAEALVGDLLTERIESGDVDPQRDRDGTWRRLPARLWRRGRPADLSSDVIEGEFAEPVQLQVVCRTLWDALPATATEITHEHLHGFGDVDQALGRFYDEAVRAAVRAMRADEGPGPLVDVVRAREGQLRTKIEEAFITPLETRGIEYRGRSAVGGIPNSAIDVLEERRLIRAEWRAGARWYELTHDRLIAPIRASNRRYRERQRRLALGAASAAALVIAVLAAAWVVSRADHRITETQTVASVNNTSQFAGAASAGTNFALGDIGFLVTSHFAKLDFGRHALNVPGQKTFALRTGSTATRITGLENSKDFLVSSICPLTRLPAHKICNISVVFVPSTRGRKIAVLRVLRKGGKPLEVTLTGIGGVKSGSG
jgi:hypothetical protein